MPSLIDQVKPDVLKTLENTCKIQYSSSYRFIIASLTNVTAYRQLTIDQLQTITTFLPNDMKPKGDMELFYGDNLLQKKYQLWKKQDKSYLSGSKENYTVKGCVMMAEMQMLDAPRHQTQLRKGLDWFRMNNAEAYMVLLD